MLARTGLNTARTAFNRKAMQQRRWTQVDTRGGKPKLVSPPALNSAAQADTQLFRFGLKGTSFGSAIRAIRGAWR